MAIRSLLAQTSSLLSGGVSGPTRDTAWADGLRGIAALGVVSSHLTLTFFRALVPPVAGGPGGEPLLFQRPIFRLVAQGQAWVAIFFILMGFVNPLKPLKQANYDDIEGALMSLSKGGINRIARLVLPAAAVTCIAWLCCQLGLFQVARHSGAYWIQVNSPDPSLSFGNAIDDLLAALRDTWTAGANIYDQPQWPLRYLMQGSLLIILLLTITIQATPNFRILAFTGVWIFCWMTAESLVGHNIIPGMILAELHSCGVTPFYSKRGRIITFGTATLGLVLMSFPSEFQDWTPWTRSILYWGSAFYPADGDLSRFICGLGAQIFCFSIFFNNHLRNLLSVPVCTWLGSISFSLYLLHGTMMRTLLAWMTYLPQYLANPEPESGELPEPSGFALFIALPIFLAATLWVANQWTQRIEPIFGSATTWLQKTSVSLGKSSGSAGSSPFDSPASGSRPGMLRVD